MANTIAVSKSDIGGMRKFFRFEGPSFIGAPAGPIIRRESDFKCKEILKHRHRSRYCGCSLSPWDSTEDEKGQHLG
jgi:hypothetical protein